MGVTSKQLHSYDYSGPYAGFRGAVVFAREVTLECTHQLGDLLMHHGK